MKDKRIQNNQIICEANNAKNMNWRLVNGLRNKDCDLNAMQKDLSTANKTLNRLENDLNNLSNDHN